MHNTLVAPGSTADHTLVDPAIKTSYDGFITTTTASYPPSATDFNKLYRDSVSKASPPVKDQGASPNSTGLTTDADGAARAQGVIDVGPFEIG